MGESYQADLSAVRSVIQQMLDASSARDLEAFVDLFTEDVIVMVPDRLPIIGKDAWRATVQGPFERSTVEQLNMPSEEIVIAGDWAFERHNETRGPSRQGEWEAASGACQRHLDTTKASGRLLEVRTLHI